MAKKETKAGKSINFSDVVSFMDTNLKGTSIVRETEKTAKKREMISTGIYVLNAALSGSLFGGIPNNRITTFAGFPGVGKSFLAYSIVKQAQALGYAAIYIDTEFSIELDLLPNYGIDIDKDKFTLIRSNIIEDLKIFVTKTLDNLKTAKEAGNEIPKVMFVLDSVGQLGSRKEVEDALAGNEKADFTKAKALTSFFRIITSDLGFLGIPFVCTNQVSPSMEMYGEDVMKGGQSLKYSSSVICYLSKAKLKTGDEDELDLNSSGNIVTAKMIKNRMAKPKKVKFEISFVGGSNPYSNLDYWCTAENYEQIGIAKGKMVDDVFVPGGNRWYVRHLGKHVAMDNLYSSKIFTQEVLNGMEPIIHDYFRYKSITEIDEIQKMLEEAKVADLEDEDITLTSDSSTSFFED